MKLKSQKKFVTLVSFLAVGTGIILFPDYTLAQIIPDTTLPVNPHSAP